MYRLFDDCKEESVIFTVDENYTLRKFTLEEVCDLLVKGECCIEEQISLMRNTNNRILMEIGLQTSGISYG